MSAWLVVLAIYGGGVALVAAVALFAVLTAVTWREERAAARTMLLSPFWPILLIRAAWKGLRYVWNAAEWGER